MLRQPLFARAPSAVAFTLCAMLGAAFLLIAAPGAAQETGPSPAETSPSTANFETNPASQVLIVDVDRILRESASGASIAAAEEKLLLEAEEELRRRRMELSAEEQALTQERDSLSPEEFEQRASAFRRRVADLRRFRRDRALEIQKAVAQARAALKKALQPILIGLMRERRATVMMDGRYVVLSASALDVTDEAIRLLDASSPPIEVTIETVTED